jgi:hypothetical protein
MKTIIIQAASLMVFAGTALAGSAPTPEPTSILMMGTGLVGLGFLAAKLRKK